MNDRNFELVTNLVDADSRKIAASRITVIDGIITSIEPLNEFAETFLIPGFVDAHVHVESSMLVPAEFARAAVVHGTVATVSDPHEIGNVLGVAGVHYMLENAATVPFKYCFGAPPCVPATKFETAGAVINIDDVTQLLNDSRIGYLSEMMNFPGVLNNDPDMMAKIAAAKAVGKPIDGHAPGLHGELAKLYFGAGITTDHECFTKEEALGKLQVGCKIAIREGSAARNFEALYSLIDEFPDQVMLCSDDKHPDELIHGHIDQLARRSTDLGLDVFNVIKSASLNAIRHYNLNVGQLRIGDPADFVELADLTSWKVLRTFIDGSVVASRGRSLIQTGTHSIVNQFKAKTCSEESLRLPAKTSNAEVIRAFDGQLITQRVTMPIHIQDGLVNTDQHTDVLKLVVLNRYMEANPAVALVNGFGLQHGAFASSVAHDSHNIIAVGTDDHSLCQAINRVIELRGGLAVADHDHFLDLPLPVAGLMSVDPIEMVSARYAELDQAVKNMGCKLRAPFMTLSFMALLVIPDLKLSDLGLFDGQHFHFTDLFV